MRRASISALTLDLRPDGDAQKKKKQGARKHGIKFERDVRIPG